MVSPFEGLLGNNCELRTIEFLLPMHGIEFNISELADEMKVTRQTLSKILKKYEEWGVVKKRTSGQAIFYTINEDSPLVKSIVQFNNVLIETMLGTETLYEIRDYLKERIPHAESLVTGGYRCGNEEQIWRPVWQDAPVLCGNATTREEPCWVMAGSKAADGAKMTGVAPINIVHPIVCERGTEYAA
ncbi:MAG: winged helix-turn-helix domain-containing protein [Methanoregula sp.]|nr:winged helix-turn-helix domain-containing protein [Methanoregula sp.]